MSDLEDLFRDLENCCLHDPQWRPADVNQILRWEGDRTTGRDSSSIVIVTLYTQPGPTEYGLLTQFEDYTGHGCQCGSMTVRETGLGKLLTHLDEYELRRLIVR